MALSMSDYALRDFAVDRVDSTLIELGGGNVRIPAAPAAFCHLVLSGTLRIRLDDAKEPVELHPGDFALLLYGAGHVLSDAERRARYTGDPVIGRWIEADELPVQRFGNRGNDPRMLSGRMQLARSPRNTPTVRALPHLLTLQKPIFTDLAPVEAGCRGPGASGFAFRLAQLHLMQVLRGVHDDFKRLMPLHLGSPEMGRIAAVVRKMREHPERRWTVASLAEEVGCSRSSFAAKFQSYAGVGPIHFAAQTRLEHAQSLLRSNPDLPIWEVAKRVGYDAQGSFTRAFKGHVGMSPRCFVEEVRRKT